jgi:hypothetical protein
MAVNFERAALIADARPHVRIAIPLFEERCRKPLCRACLRNIQQERPQSRC